MKVDISTKAILRKLCQSASYVLGVTTNSNIQPSTVVKKANQTCLHPDLGCFVFFEGDFSGLVTMSLSSQAALEIYTNFMRSMNMPEKELATLYTSDKVSNVLGELMNQFIGHFTNQVKNKFSVNISQNQPKTITIDKQILISISANLEQPETRSISFSTEKNNPFNIELTLDKVEFIPTEELDEEVFNFNVEEHDEKNNLQSVMLDDNIDDLLNELNI